MAKRKSNDPRSILPGDFLHLQVPANRFIASGLYRVTVNNLVAKSRRETTYHCSFPLDPEQQDPFAVNVHLRLSIARNTPHLTGCAFLGPDQFPVQYRHEPNLERRLTLSAQALSKERKPYADT